MARSKHQRTDTLLAALLGIASLVLYARTAAPSVAVLFDDTLEFQVVVPTLGIAHPSGYPLYTLLGKLFTLLLPWRDPAGRLNLFSALAAALAVACYYLLAQRWARQRAAALIVTTAFAIAPVWWAQATLAEVYALHGLFMALALYLLLRWEEAILVHRSHADRWLAGAALTIGLGLTHHRMIAMLVPAALVFIFWTDPMLWRQPARWVRPLLLGLAPLLLYLYLPLRGQAVTSLDGTFRPSGTLDWIMARAYGMFLTGNPFNVHRDAGFFYQMFQDQTGLVLWWAAILGILTAWRYNLRRYIFLLLATTAQVAFGVVYKVEDVGVFLLPAFMLAGLWAASALTLFLDAGAVYLARAGRGWGLPARARPWLLGGWAVALAVLCLAGPLQRAAQAFPEQDRRQAWGIYDYGEDMLAHVAQGGQVVGLGGEITLLRYFRDVLGQRPDLQVVRADGEKARLQAVQNAVAQGTPVYLTRDLPGVAARYSLDSAGPLIRVGPKATPAPAPPGQALGDGVLLVRAEPEVRQTRAGPVVRLNLTWVATTPITQSLKVSARLLDAAGNQVAAQDRVPVNFTYPTTAWVPGETVQDVYDLALRPGAPAGPYRPLIILYRAVDGREAGRAELAPVTP
jgi:hypothetical protein